MPGIAVLFLYFAWFTTWTGTFATTCTMSDAESLTGAVVFSSIPYLAAFLLLGFNRLGSFGLVFAIPLFPMMVWQAFWAGQLLAVTNIHGLSACNLIKGDNYGAAMGGWPEQVYGPYYMIVSVSSVVALAYSYWRH